MMARFGKVLALIVAALSVPSLVPNPARSQPDEHCPAWSDQKAVSTAPSGSTDPSYGFGLQIATDRKFPLYAVGEEINLTVKVHRTAYISVVSVDSGGKISELFPNPQQPDVRLEPGQALQIPDHRYYHLVAKPPAGCSLVKVIASSTPHARAPQDRSLQNADSRLAGSADWQEATLTIYVIE